MILEEVKWTPHLNFVLDIETYNVMLKKKI